MKRHERGGAPGPHDEQPTRPSSPPPHGISRRAYRLLLRIFPRGIRREYGDDMHQLFADRLHETGDNRRARAALWASALRDAAIEGLRERAAAWKTVPLDIRYAARSLRRAPGFALGVVITLGLAIGSTTATFAIVDGVLLRSLPYPQPERLVQLRGVWVDGDVADYITYPDFGDVRAQSGSFEALAALYESDRTLTGDGEPESLTAMAVSAGFGDVVGLTPALGRWFLPEEDSAGNEHVVVLSAGLWGRRFGADPAIVGQTIDLSGEPFTVIGAGPPEAPNGFPGQRRADLWIPLAFEAIPEADRPGRRTYRYQAFGRLAEGVSLTAANAELAGISARLEELYPQENAGEAIVAVGLHEHVTGAIGRSLWLLLTAVGAVLAVAVANVAGLMLNRTGERARSLALRTALGAGRGRIASQLVIEGLILAGLGGSAGILIAIWLVDLFLSLAAGSIPLASQVRLDARVLALTAAAVATTGALCGLAAALGATRGDVWSALQRGGDGRAATGSPVSTRLRRGLVGAEIALTATLLIGGGLLIKSFWLLRSVEPGFDIELLTFRVMPPPLAYPDDDAQRAFQNELLERVGAVPGVAGSAAISLLPMSGQSSCGKLEAVDREPPPAAEAVCAEVRTVTAGFFEVAGVPLLRGRPFDDRDRDGAEHAVIVNETVADRLWPGEEPLGKRLTTGWGIPRTVVGVVAGVKLYHLYEEPTLQTYLPAAQQVRRGFNVVVRGPVSGPRGASGADPLSLAPALRQAVWTIDPDLPVTGMGLVRDYVAGRESASRFRTVLVGAFAALALAVAVVGVYASIAYAVSTQRREMAVRLAVGARPREIVALVLAQSMTVVGIGLAAGLALALAGSRLLEGLLFEVAPADPPTFALVAALLLAVALAATWGPARRAARTDPIDVLRDG